MVRKPTKKRRDWQVADLECRQALLSRIGAVSNHAEALGVAMESPTKADPGHACYSNLMFFLQTFKLPNDSSAEERTAYRALLDRLVAKGDAQPDTLAEFDDSIRTSDRSSA